MHLGCSSRNSYHRTLIFLSGFLSRFTFHYSWQRLCIPIYNVCCQSSSSRDWWDVCASYFTNRNIPLNIYLNRKEQCEIPLIRSCFTKWIRNAGFFLTFACIPWAMMCFFFQAYPFQNFLSFSTGRWESHPKWLPKGIPTLDGSFEIRDQLTSWGNGSWNPMIYYGFYTCQVVVWHFWTINSMT